MSAGIPEGGFVWEEAGDPHFQVRGFLRPTARGGRGAGKWLPNTSPTHFPGVSPGAQGLGHSLSSAPSHQHLLGLGSHSSVMKSPTKLQKQRWKGGPSRPPPPSSPGVSKNIPVPSTPQELEVSELWPGWQQGGQQPSRGLGISPAPSHRKPGKLEHR